VCETRCLVASSVVDLFGLEVHAEKTECLLIKQNAETHFRVATNGLDLITCTDHPPR